MSDRTIRQFTEERQKLNDVVMRYADLSIKRFYRLDSEVYRERALPKKIKELLGLVASLALRCDDCVMYHIIRCYEEGVTSEELEETLAVGLVVGGSITIPHLRKAFQTWDELQAAGKCESDKANER